MALHALIDSPLEKIAVVVHPDDPLHWLIADEGSGGDALASKPLVQIVLCLNAGQGISQSIRSGMRSLMADQAEPEAIIIVLADQPLITKAMVAELIRYWREHPQLDFVATAAQDESRTANVLMPPALLSRKMFAELLTLEGDIGARRVLMSPAFHGRGLAAKERTATLDVDTPDDLEQARKYMLQDDK